LQTIFVKIKIGDYFETAAVINKF